MIRIAEADTIQALVIPLARSLSLGHFRNMIRRTLSDAFMGLLMVYYSALERKRLIALTLFSSICLAAPTAHAQDLPSNSAALILSANSIDGAWNHGSSSGTISLGRRLNGQPDIRGTSGSSQPLAPTFPRSVTVIPRRYSNSNIFMLDDSDPLKSSTSFSLIYHGSDRESSFQRLEMVRFSLAVAATLPTTPSEEVSFTQKTSPLPLEERYQNWKRKLAVTHVPISGNAGLVYPLLQINYEGWCLPIGLSNTRLQ